MLLQATVQGALSAIFQPFSAYITQIANLYIAADPGMEDIIGAVLLNEADQLARNAGTPLAYREAFIGCCESWGMPANVGPQIRLIALPAAVAPVPPAVAVVPPPPVNFKVQYAAEIARLQQMRTAHSRQRGRLLGQSALHMRGWFRWVQSGPREPGFWGQQGLEYGPKTQWTRTRTDVGVEQHNAKRNDFAGWLFANGIQPDNKSYMNCWEAVLFSAFRAGLVDKMLLQTVHRRAGLAYEVHHRVGERSIPKSGRHYFLALSQAFQFFASVPFVPRAGLIPREGDILFWDRDNHVAISLGRTWKNGEPTDNMMSLWHHAGKTFAQLTTEDMPEWMRSQLRFRPCPF